jgi:Putative MetA-pathway of phenol degradation
LCLLAVTGSSASAQGMRDRIRELFSFGECGRPLCLDNSVNATNGHGDHFLPDVIANNGAILGFLTDAIAASAANLPLSATASGVTFRFVGGLPVRTSTSLGPIFGERAQTLGKGRFVVGANMSGLNFTSLRGVPLNQILLNFSHDDVPPAGLGQPLRENDVLQVKLDLSVSLLVTTFYTTWGISDHVDIGLAVPMVHTGMTGRSTGQFFPFGVPTSHFFAGDSANPVLSASAATFGSATGLGDIALRAKWSMYGDENTGVAFMADARLPTGSDEDLTGSGHMSVRGILLASTRLGDFAPHLNVGYAARGGRNDAILATGGFDQPLSNWATLAVDALTEWQVGESSLKLPGDVHYELPVARTISPTNIPNIKDHRMYGSFGMKFRTPGGPIVVANALMPLRRGGLESRFIWTLGLDGNF